MKPIKLTIDEPRDYIAVGLVLNEIKDYLEPKEDTPDFKKTILVNVEADVYEVTIESQDRQIKVHVRAKQTFDDIFEMCREMCDNEQYVF